MTPARAALLIALAVSACSTIRDSEPARCHGARRPANPNGSILAADPPAAPPAAAVAGGCLGAPR
jgi:hypothetical protein